jgi:adenosyl cobinamide kinase/adenosyl cobinamide phosphate guanylyltransferase
MMNDDEMNKRMETRVERRADGWKKILSKEQTKY